MRRLSVFLVLVVAMLLAAAPVYAIQFATPDGDDHPQVGLLVAKVMNDDGNLVPEWRCSGTLLSATVFLTAGHCVFGADSIEVWFDGAVTRDPAFPSETEDDPCDGIGGYPCIGDSSGTGTANPSYDDFASFPATFDIGVVELDTAQADLTYATLADVGTLDALAKSKRKGVQFDLVGYGQQDALPPVFAASLTRHFGHASLVNTKNALTAGFSVQLTAAPGTGGALCFGDSGGPVFLAGTLEIVAVNSFVLNNQCMGSGFSYRTDIQDSQDFVDGFLNP